MKKVILVSVIALALTSTGCSVKKNWGAMGGSKSDGIVKLGFNKRMFEKPIVSEQQGIDVATQRCRRWGYSGAESFDYQSTTCTNWDMNRSCVGWVITKEYQCLGDINKEEY